MLRRALSFMGVNDVEVILAGGSLGVNRKAVKLEDHPAKFEEAIKQAAQAA